MPVAEVLLSSDLQFPNMGWKLQGWRPDMDGTAKGGSLSTGCHTWAEEIVPFQGQRNTFCQYTISTKVAHKRKATMDFVPQPFTGGRGPDHITTFTVTSE